MLWWLLISWSFSGNTTINRRISVSLSLNQQFRPSAALQEYMRLFSHSYGVSVTDWFDRFLQWGEPCQSFVFPEKKHFHEHLREQCGVQCVSVNTVTCRGGVDQTFFGTVFLYDHVFSATSGSTLTWTFIYKWLSTVHIFSLLMEDCYSDVYFITKITLCK